MRPFWQTFQSFVKLLGAEDGVGPCYEVVVSRVAELASRTIQHHLTVNYFGNLMQDYFETALIRRSNPGLPADTEGDLREEDGVRVAEIVFAEVPEKEGPLDWPTYRLPPSASSQRSRFLSGTSMLRGKASSVRGEVEFAFVLRGNAAPSKPRPSSFFEIRQKGIATESDEMARDLVEIAAAVNLADRFVRRSVRSGHRTRIFTLEVPVSDERR